MADDQYTVKLVTGLKRSDHRAIAFLWSDCDDDINAGRVFEGLRGKTARELRSRFDYWLDAESRTGTFMVGRTAQNTRIAGFSSGRRIENVIGCTVFCFTPRHSATPDSSYAFWCRTQPRANGKQIQPNWKVRNSYAKTYL